MYYLLSNCNADFIRTYFILIWNGRRYSIFEQAMKTLVLQMIPKVNKNMFEYWIVHRERESKARARPSQLEFQLLSRIMEPTNSIFLLLVYTCEFTIGDSGRISNKRTQFRWVFALSVVLKILNIQWRKS